MDFEQIVLGLMILFWKLLLFCAGVVAVIAAAMGIAVLISIARGKRIILDPREYEYRYENGEWILVKRYGEGEKDHARKIRGKLRQGTVSEEPDEQEKR